MLKASPSVPGHLPCPGLQDRQLQEQEKSAAAEAQERAVRCGRRVERSSQRAVARRQPASRRGRGLVSAALRCKAKQPARCHLRGRSCSEMQEREARLGEELAQAQAGLEMLRRLHQASQNQLFRWAWVGWGWMRSCSPACRQ